MLVWAVAMACPLARVSAEEPDSTPPAHQVLSAGQTPADARLQPPKTLNDHFPFAVPESVEAWRERADSLRRRVLVANGLWPMPRRSPIEPVIHGEVKRDGFTVERVYFESLPGHYVTGLLFRPSEPSSTPRPGVLCPHGHGGRMQRHSDEELARQLASGAEKFEGSGRYPKLARCAQLARMGCVAFIFDMLGYEDSVQIEFEVAHRHKDPRPEENEPGPWCFFSPQADLRLQSIMGLQTWNAIRALDFLASLPDVDPERLAVTGGSGGGTQSILLGAIDDRLKASFPNGMVSTSMQGGCYCENCCLMRIGTGNVELAALFAPRPQGMTAADDWTREMMTDGYPELNRLYTMLGVPENVLCRPLLQFPHNYNYVTRATMYGWMNRHLGLGLEEPIVEQDFEPLSEAEAAVWNGEHPAPAERGVPHERKVLQWFDEQARRQLDVARPTDREGLTAFHDIVGAAWKVIFDLPLPDSDSIESETVRESTMEGVTVVARLLSDPARGTQLPVLVVRPREAAAETTVIWSDGAGKAAAFDEDGRPGPVLERLLDRGADVVLPDLFGQGELSVEGVPAERQRLVDDERDYSAFTFGYNRTLVAERVGDLLTVIAAATRDPDRSVTLLGTNGAATWVLPAASVAGHRVAKVAVDTGRFRFAEITDHGDADFVPGAVKYGDLPALMALRAPYPLRLSGEPEIPSLAASAYAAADARGEVARTDDAITAASSLGWLVE